MTTECNAREFDFQGLGSRAVTARFDGGAITSDAGGLLLREVEARTGILRRFAACFTDHRDPDRVEHTVGELLAQRVFALALGYEDLNDHDTLRHDPLLAVLVGKADPTGQDRRRNEDRGKSLAGKSTLNRLELTPVGADAKSRYKKIVARHHDIELVLRGDVPGVASHAAQGDRARPRRHRRSDPRPSVGPVLSRLLRQLLLLAAVHFLWRTSAVRQAAAVGHRRCGRFGDAVARIVERIRRQWPDVRIIVRGDSGFCRESLMCWCEANHVHYVLGLAKERPFAADSGQGIARGEAAIRGYGPGRRGSSRTSRIRRGRVGVVHVAWWARPNTWPRGAIRDSW